MNDQTDSECIDMFMIESVKALEMSVSIIKHHLELYPETTAIGQIIRKLILWNRGEIPDSGARLFRNLIQFGDAGFLQQVSRLVSFHLLDDGGINARLDHNGHRVFVEDYDDPMIAEVILSEMEYAEHMHKKAADKRQGAVLRRLIVFLEEKGYSVNREQHDKLAELETT